MITFRQLEIFVEVVRSGSFRRCGERLGMSQVSVSEHVRALEQRLGATLFDRQSGGAPVITEKGRIVHIRVLEILALIGDLKAEVDERPTNAKRQLGLGVDGFLARDLPPVLQAFEKAHPQVDVRLETQRRTQAELEEMIAGRQLDLAYFFALDAVRGTRLVRHENLAVFVGEGHPLANEPVVDVEDLARMPAIQLTQRDPLRALVDRAFAAIGLAERCVGIETDDFGQILGSAQRSIGYACLFEATAQNPSRPLGLKKLTLNRQLPALQVQCASRPSAARDARILSLMDTVEDCWERCAAQ